MTDICRSQPRGINAVRASVLVQGLVGALACLPAGADAADIALGEYLSSECVTCHQLSGQSTGGIPSIVGLPEHAFTESLIQYRSGKRDNEVMRNIAARLSDEDIASLAAYFATQGQK